jgi:type IV pilus assembly protein PilW
MKPRTMRRRANGFSMIELLVSVVIGLLALGFATRLVVRGEVNKQAAVGGSDSMQNGVLALFSMERELNQAGWSMNDPLIVGCDTVFSDSSGYAMLTAPRGGATVTPLAAVLIQSNGNDPDVVSINSGTAMSNTGMARLSGNYVSGAGIDIDRSPYGFNGTDTVLAGGDVIVVAPEAAGASKCALAQVSAPVAPGTPNGQNRLLIAAGGNNRFNSGNLGVAFSSLQARLFNLGPASNLSFHTWSVNGGFLQMRASNLAGAIAAPAPVTDNIVSLKAQYGFDGRAGPLFTPELGMQVGTWSGVMVDADGDGVAGSAGDYQRVAAVRIAVVARSRAPERPNASNVCTATPNLPTVFGNVSVTVAVTGDTIDWKCYRYRVFETIVPLRNSAWRPTAS